MVDYDKYETVIGLEVHVQLGTDSKAFCGDSTTFGAAPNTQISTISLGHPGTLPLLNERQVAFAVRLGLALGCDINRENNFDRKNYFYADLPKGYQVTQDRRPVCVGGGMDVETETGSRYIRLHHIHMEEDAGKSIHDLLPGASAIDLNRAGVPLLEIVTEPDFRSAQEVDVFMTNMRQLVRYLEISDGNMQEGSLRCDCNVSVRLRGDEQFNERCEIKNMNSMRFARRAIEYERKRQIGIMERGEKVAQQTLNFDPDPGRTSPLRDKEAAHDYRYFPEPDLPPVVISEAYLENVRTAMPALPWEIRAKLEEDYSLSAYDARLLTEEKETALFYENLVQETPHYKAAANLVINKIRPWRNEEQRDMREFPIPAGRLANFLELIENGQVSNSVAYQQLFPLLLRDERSPLELANANDWIQNSDVNFLEELIDEVLAANPEKVTAYQKGKKGLMGFFMGQIMRASKGQAEPKTTTALLAKKLSRK